MSMRLWTPAQGIPCPQAIWDSLLVWIQIQEKDIIGCENGQVTYRWRDSKTKKLSHLTTRAAQHLQASHPAHKVGGGFRRFGLYDRHAQRLPRLCQARRFARRCQQSIVANSLDARWQDMQH